MAKVAFIGAGSVEFTRNVLADLLSAADLPSLQIALHDIDGSRLATAENLARVSAARLGREVDIVSSVERRRVLDGAHYVICEIQVGGFEATLRDFTIPAKHGLRQTIADTIGIGGIMRGLRTLPVMISLGEDMADLCPDAWLLNYANPMAMVPWAVYAGSHKKERVIGLCHSVRDTHAHLASIASVPVEECEFVTAGFNHQAFVLRFAHEGVDLYPTLRAKLLSDPTHSGRVRVELFRRFGYFPTESSEHSSEYVPWFLRDDDLVRRFHIPVDEYIHRSEENIEIYEETRKELEQPGSFSVTPTNELAFEVIHSLETGEARTVYANLRNEGLIENLPPDCCVEVPCLFNGSGIHPVGVGELPPQLAALNRTFLNVVELTVKAVLQGSRSLVYQAAYLDPNAAGTLSLEEIRAMCDELIEAQGDLIPEAIRADCEG